MNTCKKSILRYGVAFLIGCAIVFVVAWVNGVFSYAERVDAYRILCDGCFAAAVLLIGIGLLVWISNLGTFDILRYGMRSLVGLYSREAKNRKPEGSFYEYQTIRAARQAPFAFLLFIGCLFLVGAFMFNVFFAKVAPL